MIELSRFPLRYVLPSLIAALAALSSFISYYNSKPLALEGVEQEAREDITASLMEVRSVIESHLSHHDISGTQHMLDAFSRDVANELLFLADADGRILASTNPSLVDRSSVDVVTPAELDFINENSRSGGPFSSLSSDRLRIYGHALLCAQLEDPDDCSLVFQRRNIAAKREQALGTLRRQAGQNGFGNLIAAILLWMLIHAMLTSRVDRLVQVVNRFKGGESTARARFTGNDELAIVARHVDQMLDQVADDQTVLRLRDRVLAASTNGVVITDANLPENPIIYCNPAFTKITGYTPEEVIGRNSRFLHRDDRDQPGLLALRAALEKNMECEVLLRNYRKDGTMFWDQLKIAPVKDDNGCVTHYVGIQNDVTHLKLVEEKLRYREEALRLTIDNAPVGIVTADLDYLILSANRTFSQMSGYSQDELIGRSFTELIHPEDRVESLRAMRATLTAAVARQPLEQRCVRKNGGTCHAQIYLAVARDLAGRPTQLIAQIVDRTDQLRIEREIEQQKRRLAHVSRVSTMGEMAAGIAHEVNQPLAAISSFSQAAKRLLESDKLDARTLVNVLTQIAEQSQRAGDVIRRLRAMVSNSDEERVRASLGDLIRDTLMLARTDTRSLNIRFETHIEPDLPSVWVDPVQIQQVLLNLVRNAIDAVENSEEKLIDITAGWSPSDEVSVAVTDFGEGIPEPVAEQLFKPFFTTKDSGLGMGLSICQSIITAHGGRVWFTPNANRTGSTFSFSLPSG